MASPVVFGAASRDLCMGNLGELAVVYVVYEWPTAMKHAILVWRRGIWLHDHRHHDGTRTHGLRIKNQQQQERLISSVVVLRAGVRQCHFPKVSGALMIAPAATISKVI